MENLLWGAGPYVLAVVLIAALIAFSRVSEKKFREALAGVLGDPEIRWNAEQNAFQWRNKHYRYAKYPGSRNSPPTFSLFLECSATGGELELTRENGLERFFKNVGVTREVQTGEDAFDRLFFITSDTPAFARRCFEAPERREAARRIFNKKADKIVLHGNLLSVVWKGSSSHVQGVSNLKEAMEVLAIMAKELPPSHECIPAVEGGDEVRRNPVPLILAAGVLAAGAGSTIWGASRYPVFDVWELFLFTLKFSLPALVIFLYFAVADLAGNSRSHRNVLWTGAMALAGFLLLGCGLACLYNGMNDTSAPAEHTTVVAGKHLSRSKNSTTYKLTVMSWRPGRTLEDLTTNRTAYARVVPGKTRALVLTKPGKLGFEWFVSYRLRA